MPHCALLSFRYGPTDGVSVVARNWRRAFEDLGFGTTFVAGAAHADIIVPGLGIDDTEPPTHEELASALAHADLVVVENLLSIPLNLPASRVVAEVLRGRPAILHHHDPPWQRERFAHITELPPDDPAWRHVTINRLTEREMAARGIRATTIYNGFDVDAPIGDRSGTRTRLGIAHDELLVAHPVRAIARKNIPGALAITEALGGVYWLLGPAEEGYDVELAALLADARCSYLHESAPSRSDIYAAADLVVFPSTWEGFGNPPVEAAIFRRPVVVGDYPVAEELRGLGFHWFRVDEVDAVRAFLAAPDQAQLDADHELARRHLSLERMGIRLAALLEDAGWSA
jgi:glycosyltransferase involved in cell wall biosynthesis